MTNTILVTGGAGFIGSHLVRRLLDEGNRVISLDNFQTGSAENHLDVLRHPHFELVQHDVVEPINIAADRIFNLACPASPVHYQASHIKTLQTSLIGAMNVLDLAAKNHARILQASTSEVYGDPLVHPQPETYLGNTNPFGERACYDEGKRASEALFYAYRREANVDIRIARIFNTYGPGMRTDDGRVVSNFIVQALRNEPITVYGDGRQTRSFCYVDDTVDGLIRLMDGPIDTPVNLGNPVEFTVRQLAEMIIELTGSRSEIVSRKLPSDDPKLRQPDITLAQTNLGWNPQIALRDGLLPTIAFFEGLLSRTRPRFGVLPGRRLVDLVAANEPAAIQAPKSNGTLPNGGGTAASGEHG
jgi:UDP-glucuronate decarboxylase